MLEEDKEDLVYPTVTPQSQETMQPNLQMEALGVENAIAPIVQFNAPIEDESDAFSIASQVVTPRQVDVKRDLAQKYIKQYPDFLKAENIIPKTKIKTDVEESLEEEGFFKRQALGLGVGAVRGGILANGLVEGYNQLRSFTTGDWKDDTFDPTRDDLVSSYASIDPRYWPSLLAQPNEAKWKAKFEAMSNENTLTQLHDSLRWWELTPGYMAGFGLDYVAAPFRMAIGAKTIGGSMLKTAAVDLAKGAASAGLYEIGVQGMQQLTRDQLSLEESALNVGIATLFGGALGAAGGVIKYGSIDHYKTLMSQELKGAEVQFDLNKKGQIQGFVAMDDSAGAMKVTNYSFQDFAVSGFTTQEGSNFYWNPIKPIMNTVTQGVVKTVEVLGGNPVLRGLMSKSQAMRDFTAGMLRPNFDIDAVQLHGKVRPHALDETLRSEYAKFYDIESIINEGWSEYLGVDTLNKSAARIKAAEALAKIKHEGLNQDNYNRELTRSLSNNGESQYPVIAKTAKKIIERTTEIMDKLKDLGMPLPDKPRFDQSYLNRVYDYRYLHENPEASVKALKEGFEDNQRQAQEILKPITEQQAKIALKKQALEEAKDEASRAVLSEQLKNENLTLSLIEKELENKILRNEIDDRLLIGESGMSYTELKELELLRKPIEDLKAKIKQLESTKPKNENLIKQIDEAKAELAAKQLEIEVKAINEPKFKDRLTYKDADGKIKLKEPNKGTRKIRPAFESIDELTLAAQKTYDTLIGMTPEQIDDYITQCAKAGSGGTDMMAPRVLAFNENQLLDMKLLNPDPKVRLNGWYRRAVKYIESEKYFRSKGWTEGKGKQLDFITNGISDDYGLLRENLIKKFVEKKKGKTPKQIERIEAKQRKESDKLNKRQAADVKVAKEIYHRIMGPGIDNRGLGMVFVNTANSSMDASFLGATALLQLQELASPALTKGWKAHFAGGLIPFFANFLVPWSKGNAVARQQCRNFGKAIQMQMYFMSRDANFSGNSVPNGLKIPFTNWSLQAGIHRLNKFMQMWTLSGPIASMTETISTMGTQYAIADALRRHSKGILSKKGLAYLHQVGIDPNSAIGKRIAYELEKEGVRKYGYQLSNTHLWESREAKQVFDTAVFGDVSATIFNGPDVASWPVYAGDPRGISRFFFKYMGWGMTAMSNYLIPTLQGLGRSDFDRLSTMGAMVAISALVDPLRKLSRGEEPDLDPMNLLWGGFINSGVAGPMSDMIARSSYMLGISEPSSGDRFRYSRGLISSAPETMVFEVQKMLRMALTGEVNKRDLQRTIKIVAPWLDTIWMRPLEYSVINDLDIPETPTKTVIENLSDLF